MFVPVSSLYSNILESQQSKSTRKSKSPRKSVALDMADSKVLTPSRKPPLPLHHDDAENLEPDELTSRNTPLRFSRRRSSSHAAGFDPCVTKILTPKVNTVYLL